MSERILTISQLNNYIKRVLENDIYLMNINVSGEISNIKYHTSGHLYFSLKDDKSKINAIMFNSYARNLKDKFKDGDKVVVSCKVGVYEASGSYQLYVTSMSKMGLGDLYIEFEKLKKKLDEEGLFSLEYKKPIKKYPTKIALISAATGAAIQDMKTTAKRRWPIAELTLFPSLVQGKEASLDIVKNIKEAGKGDFDLIILARGGGSIEDLWPFNEEIVARAIVECPLPIVSGVGHEIDFTIADFASSLRAPTPTAAIEMVTPNINDVYSEILEYQKRIINALKKRIEDYKKKINELTNRYVLKNPLSYLENKMILIDKLITKLEGYKEVLISNNLKKIDLLKYQLKANYDKYLTNKKHLLMNLTSSLDSISPLKVIYRGYGIITSKDKIVKSIDDVSLKEKIKIRVSDGSLLAIVEEKESNGNSKK